ncbi:MAG: choice-of-anchor Q domain-containing protein [Anaerolineae bacterium]
MVHTPRLNRPTIIFSTVAIALLIALQLIYSTTSAATFTVTNTDDTGPGSLRQAITDTLTSPGSDRITFDPALDGKTITLASGRLTLVEGISIDASNLENKITVSGNYQSKIFHVSSGASVTLTNLTLISGTAQLGGGSCENACGGAIYSDIDTNVLVIDSEVMGNLASGGGGIFNGGTMHISGTIVTGNVANFEGGGIHNEGAMTITQSSIISNSTDTESLFSGGGGIYNGGFNDLLVENSTIAHNSAHNNGGGFYLAGGFQFTSSIRIVNSTISENSANSSGGGIFSTANSTSTVQITLVHNTIFNNSGSGFHAETDASSQIQTQIQNTIIASSSDANCVAVTGDVSNVSNDKTCIGFKTGDPQLAPLADNGGATLTHALLPNSQAFSLGNPAVCEQYPTDQRGVSRSAEACDAGSGEFLDTFIAHMPFINR